MSADCPNPKKLCDLKENWSKYLHLGIRSKTKDQVSVLLTIFLDFSKKNPLVFGRRKGFFSTERNVYLNKIQGIISCTKGHQLGYFFAYYHPKVTSCQYGSQSLSLSALLPFTLFEMNQTVLRKSARTFHNFRNFLIRILSFFHEQ